MQNLTRLTVATSRPPECGATSEEQGLRSVHHIRSTNPLRWVCLHGGALLTSVDQLRRAEVRLFGGDPNSSAALKLAGLRMELLRLLCGLPVRMSSIEKILGLEKEAL